MGCLEVPAAARSSSEGRRAVTVFAPARTLGYFRHGGTGGEQARRLGLPSHPLGHSSDAGGGARVPPAVRPRCHALRGRRLLLCAAGGVPGPGDPFGRLQPAVDAGRRGGPGRRLLPAAATRRPRPVPGRAGTAGPCAYPDRLRPERRGAACGDLRRPSRVQGADRRPVVRARRGRAARLRRLQRPGLRGPAGRLRPPRRVVERLPGRAGAGDDAQTRTVEGPRLVGQRMDLGLDRPDAGHDPGLSLRHVQPAGGLARVDRRRGRGSRAVVGRVLGQRGLRQAVRPLRRHVWIDRRRSGDADLAVLERERRLLRRGAGDGDRDPDSSSGPMRGARRGLSDYEGEGPPRPVRTRPARGRPAGRSGARRSGPSGRRPGAATSRLRAPRAGPFAASALASDSGGHARR